VSALRFTRLMIVKVLTKPIACFARRKVAKWRTATVKPARLFRADPLVASIWPRIAKAGRTHKARSAHRAVYTAHFCRLIKNTLG
jgi:hypothetical protein